MTDKQVLNMSGEDFNRIMRLNKGIIKRAEKSNRPGLAFSHLEVKSIEGRTGVIKVTAIDGVRATEYVFGAIVEGTTKTGDIFKLPLMKLVSKREEGQRVIVEVDEYGATRVIKPGGLIQAIEKNSYEFTWKYDELAKDKAEYSRVDIQPGLLLELLEGMQGHKYISLFVDSENGLQALQIETSDGNTRSMLLPVRR